MTCNDLIGIISFLFLVDLNEFHEGPNRYNIIRSGFSSKFKLKHLYCVVQATESIRPEEDSSRGWSLENQVSYYYFLSIPVMYLDARLCDTFKFIAILSLLHKFIRIKSLSSFCYMNMKLSSFFHRLYFQSSFHLHFSDNQWH